jgi:hypothetical protein
MERGGRVIDNAKFGFEHEPLKGGQMPNDLKNKGWYSFNTAQRLVCALAFALLNACGGGR